MDLFAEIQGAWVSRRSELQGVIDSGLTIGRARTDAKMVRNYVDMFLTDIDRLGEYINQLKQSGASAGHPREPGDLVPAHKQHDTYQAGAMIVIRTPKNRDPAIFVLVRHPDSPVSWNLELPGGARNVKDKNCMETAIRECAEETGMTPMKGISPAHLTDWRHRGLSYDWLCAYYVTNIDYWEAQADASFSDEFITAKWLDAAELQNILDGNTDWVLRPAFKEILPTVIKYLTNYPGHT